MNRSYPIMGAALLAAFGILGGTRNVAQEKPKNKTGSEEIEYKPTAEDLAKKNPGSTPEGLAAARKLYGYHCAMCHGKTGDGKGDLAAEMKLELRDWRDASTIAGRTDAELFYIVSNGKGKMLGGEGDRTTEQVRWNLVNVVRSFGKKDAAEKAKTPGSL
jgi:mono/diheme cytochrome c family protein